MRAAAPEIALAVICDVGVDQIGDVTVEPSPGHLVVTATPRAGARVMAAFRISTAVAYLWPTGHVSPDTALRVLVDRLEAEVPAGWLHDPTGGLPGWRAAAVLRFRS